MLKYIPFDIRAEFFGCMLMMEFEHLDIEDLLVNPLGARKEGKDIRNIKEGFSQNSNKDTVHIDLNREGLYDTLPKGLFIAQDASIESPAAQAGLIKKQKEEAKKFLSPFEHFLYYLRLKIAKNEFTFDDNAPEFFLKIWGLTEFKNILDDHQKKTLFSLLPLTKRIVGDLGLTQDVFSIVLNKPVEITLLPCFELKINKEHIFNLGEGKLGEDFLLGEGVKDGFPIIEVKISEIRRKELWSFFLKYNDKENKEQGIGNAPNTILKEILFAYFLPMEMEVKIQLELAEEKKEIKGVEWEDFELSSSGNNSILGYTTIL